MSYQGKRAAYGYHGFDYSPVGLWQLNGNLLDSSPTKANLTVETGTEEYSEIVPGIRGFNCNGSTSLIYNVTGTALQIIGDVTIEAIVSPAMSAQGYVVSYSTNDTNVQSTNILYTLIMNAAPSWLQTFWQNGSGVNNIFPATSSSSRDSYVFGQPMHVVFVRKGNAAQFYMNGRAIDTPSTGFTAPDPGSGTSCVFRIGGLGGTSVGSPLAIFTGIVASVKLMASALSQSQVQDEYNRTLGRILGFQNAF